MCNMLDESDCFNIFRYGSLVKMCLLQWLHAWENKHHFKWHKCVFLCLTCVPLVLSEEKSSHGWLHFLLYIHLLDCLPLKLAIKGRTSKWHYSGSQACCPSGSKMKVSLEDSLMSTNEICFLCLAGCRLVYYRRCCSRATISLGYTSAETSLAAWLITCARKQTE